MRLGFIGTGAITASIVSGIVKSNWQFEEIYLSPRNPGVAARLAQLSDRIIVSADNQAVIDGSDVVFLAVRPQIAKEVVLPLTFRPDQRVINLVAGLNSDLLAGWIASAVAICRAIPVPLVADLCGVTAVYPHDPVAMDIFSALGTVVKARGASDFDLFGAACCTMGTFFGILESIARWMESRGMEYGTARAFVPALSGGLSQVARSSPSKSLEELRSEFSTSGGLNEKVFDIFRSHGGPQALTDGLDAVVAWLAARS